MTVGFLVVVMVLQNLELNKKFAVFLLSEYDKEFIINKNKVLIKSFIMKRFFITMISLLVIFTARFSAEAQEVTIDLLPGWNYISYPYPTTVELDTFFKTITPMNDDVIKSKWDSSRYLNGQWRGRVKRMNPGEGYHYFSNNPDVVTLVLDNPIVSEQTITVTTGGPTDITAESATIGGEVMLLTDTHVFMRGVCWGTTSEPDIDGIYFLDGAGEGAFTVTLDELTPNTTYYVRTYAVSDHGLAYGEEQSFTTMNGIPAVITAPVTDVLGDGATCGGTVTDDGGLAITARGVCWGTEPEPTIADAHTTDGTGMGDFISVLTDLDLNTTYYIRAYATTTQTTAYGEEMSFTTMNGIPAVTTAMVSNITSNGATCGGTVTSDGGLAITARGVCWSTSQSPTIIDSHSDDGTGTGDFVSALVGLEPNTTYYVRAYATNSYVTVYGNRRSFTTQALPSYTVSVTVNPIEGGTIIGGGTYQQGQSCTVSATANSGYTFTNWTENGSQVSTNVNYTFTVTENRTLVANFTQNGGGDDHDYVDLGLPSGLLWATCNVGADNPEDYGDYFAWGEITTKDTYNWSTYQYCNGSSNTLTKYCSNSSYGYNGFTDNLTTLLPEDDAATANWGTDWRMPTKEEWQELFNNTTVTWTTQNGVNGRLFTASSGNSLFLPAAGYRYDGDLYYAGDRGQYWSSSLPTVYPDDAWYFYFNSDSYYMDLYYGRNYGRSVRPVRSSQNSAPTGAINGLFSVSADQQVYFSQGNLQYQASTDTWKFAENQWDMIGSENSNISENYAGWIDLFGWGTSGYNHGANCYQPWSTSTSYNDYYAYGNNQYNLYDQTGQADWGYNPISNGGNQTNQWRTLTYAEWQYVFDTRATTSGIRYAKAIVNNINGVILLPDDWSISTYSLSNTNSSSASFSSNTISASQWTILESAGAVFLPAAGYRNGTSVYGVGSRGCYWSASRDSSAIACCVYFSVSYLYTIISDGRYYGQSVRLVCPAE